MESVMTRTQNFGGALAAIGMLVLGAGAAAQPPPSAAPQPGPAAAQTPPAAGAEPKSAAPRPGAASPLAQLSWLEGCWRGEVNYREFREHWLPLRGNLLVGISHTVLGGKTSGFEYLRLENRADGIYYVVVSGGTTETALKFQKAEVDGENTTFVFANPALEFPQQLSYRRQPDGWLYVTLDGKVSGAERQVIYPMRRIGCESGEVIVK
jgi:hypothetical protein